MADIPMKVQPLIALLVMLGPWMTSVAKADEADLWRAMQQPGHVVLMRHALAPGTGDPANFTLEDCATQRNLSDNGRNQARGIGDRFRANGITEAKVLTSAWCRCRETAELLRLGPVEVLPALNSFFGHPQRKEGQIDALRDWLGTSRGEGPFVLVTHQVIITALTNIFPRSGEMVIARVAENGDLSVLGTIETGW
jgi:broad specificity phosphatase PhoE